MIGPLPASAVVALAAAVGFAAGSVPVGLVLLRLTGGPDPRQVGSGNIGATNVARAGGLGLGLATLVLDAVKAYAPAVLFASISPLAGAVAGGAAVAGHCLTPWLRFRGGKGVSCQLGASLALVWPWGGVVFGVAWLGVALPLRFVSVASLVASWAVVAAAALTGAGAEASVALAFGAALVSWRHRANLGRLARGEEPRLGQKRPLAGEGGSS